MKIDNLDGGTPYIEDLGQMPSHGGGMTTQALGEEESGGGFCGTPPPSYGSPWGDLGGLIRQHLGSKIPGHQPNPGATTLAAFGEE
ncbi:MAG: hypothetical protein ACR2P1_24130 [Pseudomonadales bacterium]